ncbi:MAG: nicotinate (nicotinamide) nucleotide adenylyltransferase [Clostridia bacterium]|nr:nicotinate (nicotinamide) nucleotide adenylyltransferase [Clostridia bacterium]
MKIGIFGGSFDPPHNEHIRLAQTAIDGLGLDKLFVMPAYAPPHKRGKTLSPDSKRLEMCRLAFAGVEKAEVSDYEIERKGTSYTYLTCRYFKERYPSAEIFWLVGTDMLRDFPTWKNPTEILENVRLAVCARNENADWLQKERKVFFEKFGKDFAIIDYNGQNVSSTKIRVLAGAGMRVDAYTPVSVAEYIEKNKLYEIAGAKQALALEKPERVAHSLRVAELAVARAPALKIPEKQAITASLFHDCGKYLTLDNPLLDGFIPDTRYGEIPASVLHQYTGAYVAEKRFGVTDEEVLDAIRYHTSGRENMRPLEQLVFLADMLEEGRDYDCVALLRGLFWQGDCLERCLEEALYQTLLFLEKKGGEIYPLTKKAYQFYKEKGEKYDESK